EARVAEGSRVAQAHGAQGQRRPAATPPEEGPAPRRLQARVRPPRREALPRRRDLARHVPPLGREDAAEARQGPLPPGPRWGGRRVSRGLSPRGEGGKVRVLVRL